MEEKKSLRKYFNKSQFSLNHPDPVRFAQGPWHPGIGPPVRPAFLMFRIITTSLFVGSLLWSIILHWRSGRWLIFATHWSLAMCVLQSILGCFIVVSEFLRHKMEKESNQDETITMSFKLMPRLYKFYWVTYNMALPVAFAVTALYWGVVFPSGQQVQEGPSNMPLNVTIHAGNSILCLLELFFGGPPSRPAHALHTFLFGISYMLFNLLYWTFGGLGPFNNPFIYRSLDWGGKPGPSIALGISSMILLVLFHWMVCGLAKIRSSIAKWKYEKDDSFSNVQLPELNSGKYNTAYIP